jgi:hypothetical protein
VHKAEFLHRDIAPDNIIIRNAGDPVLIDFGAARSDIAAHSKTKTVSALVKPGYSPYEQYAETSRQQGPWTDIYALAATLYQAVTGKRPPDSPSRMLKDEYIPARDAALGAYRATFLDAIDRAMSLSIDARPHSVAEWRGALLAPEPKKPGFLAKIRGDKSTKAAEAAPPKAPRAQATRVQPVKTGVPPPPDAPGPMGQLLDFFDGLKSPVPADAGAGQIARPNPEPAVKAEPKPATRKARASAKSGKAAGTPVPVPKVPSRPRPAPDVGRRRVSARGFLTKFAIAAGVVGALFTYRDQLPQNWVERANLITTGAITVPTQGEAHALTEAHAFHAHTGAVEGVSFSGDGRLIVTTGADNVMKIWNAATRSELGSLTLDKGPATTLTVRNNRALTAHADGSAIVWDLDAKRKLFTFKRNDASIWAAAFAGSEDQIATASHDWTVALWQTSSEAAPVRVLEGHANAVQALAADPSGHWLASGGADQTVKLWDLEAGDLRRTYRNHSDFISALAVSNDGAMLAAASLDGAIKLWPTTSSRSIRTLNNHSARVTSVAFSPAGDLIASAAEDGTVRVRGLKRAKPYLAMHGLERPAKTLAFSPDGLTLATGGTDGTVTLWSLPEPKVAQR